MTGFENGIIVCLCVVFFMFLGLRFIDLLRSLGFEFLPNLEIWGPLFLQIFFSIHIYLSSSISIPIIRTLSVWSCPTVPWWPIHSIFFLFCVLVSVLQIVPYTTSLSWLIIYSATSNLSFKPSSVFFISHIVDFFSIIFV